MQLAAQFSAIATRQKIDKSTGVIYGVSVVTEGEAKGHGLFIDHTTLKQVMDTAATYAGGLKVKVNHGEGLESIVGVLKNFVLDGQQLRADLHLLKTSEDGAKIVEMAETMPESFGLSISFSNHPEEIEGKKFARCAEIYSADLVDGPAANPTGLFSAGLGCYNHHEEHELEAHHIHYGSMALHHFLTGRNPPGFVKDEKKWAKAKEAALQTYKLSDHAFWPAVVHIYEKMGGEIHKGEEHKEMSVKHMSKAIALALGLQETATDEEIAVSLKKAIEANKPTDLSVVTADIQAAKTELAKLTSAAAAAAEQAKKTEIAALVAEASRDGKVIPLTDVQLSKMDIADVKEMIAKLPKGQVSLSAKKANPPVDKDGKSMTRQSKDVAEFCRTKRQEGAEALTELFRNQMQHN